MKKPCLECGDTFIGRSDKKFCCSDCRSRFHHKNVHQDTTTRMRNINRLLRNNRRILSEFKNSGAKSIVREMLLEMGFSFQYCTHVQLTKKGNLRKFCYDIGYYDKADRIYLLEPGN